MDGFLSLIIILVSYVNFLKETKKSIFAKYVSPVVAVVTLQTFTRSDEAGKVLIAPWALG